MSNKDEKRDGTSRVESKSNGDGNDNVIEKDFASAFDHERRGGFGVNKKKKKKRGADVAP